MRIVSYRQKENMDKSVGISYKYEYTSCKNDNCCAFDKDNNS
jgi:hypothetical protein